MDKTTLYRIVNRPIRYLAARVRDMQKHSIVRGYLQRYEIKSFVETGTYLGGMVEAVRDSVNWVYTIELNAQLFEMARERFAGANITVLHGDSGVLLPNIIDTLRSPALFWLDAHYSAKAVTARAPEYDTPILIELEALKRSTVAHIILIDDARLFNGTNDYPTVEYIRALFSDKRVTVEDDIIRITPL